MPFSSGVTGGHRRESQHSADHAPHLDAGEEVNFDDDDPGSLLKRHGSNIHLEEKPTYCIINTIWFNVSVNLLTLINTLQMGFEADYPHWSLAWTFSENIFTAGFSLEMIIKLFVLKCEYFKDTANWLDGSLTVLGILDCWVLSNLPQTEGADLQSLSILRILRMLRLVRVIKLVRNFKPLVLVLQGVVSTVTTAFYVFALLVIIFYVFAIFLTEHLGKKAEGDSVYPGYSTDPDYIDDQSFMMNFNPYVSFGSMTSSMLTLFGMAIMAEWQEVIRPICLKQPYFIPLFLFFAVVVAFGVLNVMIGLIVDSVIAESKRIDDLYSEKLRNQKRNTLKRVQKLLVDMDTNSDSVIDVHELSFAMENSPLLNDLLKDINLPSGWSDSELLDMLDNKGEGVLEKVDFTRSFFRLMESDDFQQICIMQASMNQVKTSLNHLKQVFMSSDQVVRETLSVLKADMGLIKTAMDLGKDSPPDLITNGSECQNSSNGHGKISNEEFAQSLGGSCDDLRERIPKLPEKQLMETLDAACSVMKDFFQKELLTTKQTLETNAGENCNPTLEVNMKARKSAVEANAQRCEDPSADHARRLEGTLSQPTGTLGQAADLPAGKSSVPLHAPIALAHTGTNLPLTSQVSLISGHPHAALSQRSTDNPCTDARTAATENIISGTSAKPSHHDTCAVVECNIGTGIGKSSDCVPTSHTSTVHVNLMDGSTDQASTSIIYESAHCCDFRFEDGIAQLGLELCWLQDGLPLIGGVSPNGAAEMCGVLPGDRLAECNGVPIIGKDRAEVLQLLRVRPLSLRTIRIDR